jgi:hypothetical protein
MAIPACAARREVMDRATVDAYLACRGKVAYNGAHQARSAQSDQAGNTKDFSLVDGEVYPSRTGSGEDIADMQVLLMPARLLQTGQGGVSMGKVLVSHTGSWSE